MNYYTPLSIDYDKNQIGSLLEKTTPSGRMSDARCSDDLRNSIAKVLGWNLPIVYILYFQLNPTVLGETHTDIPPIDPHRAPKHAILLPIENTEHVYMNWFHETESSIRHEIAAPSGHKSICTERGKCQLIDRVQIDRPYLIKINNWHAIDNSGPDIARILSIRFSSYISESAIIKMFGPA